MNSSLVYEDEYFLARMMTLVKKIIITSDSKPDPNKFLFINIAYNKTLIPHLGDAEEELGSEVITDRKTLATILSKIATSKTPPKMVILDVVLESKSNDDSLLTVNAKKLGNKIIVSANETDGKITPPVIPINYALASFTTIQEGLLGITSDAFFKYHPVTNNGTKNISLKIFEHLHNKKINSHLFWNSVGNVPLFKSFIIDQPIRYYDLFLAPQEKRFPLLYANDFNLLPNEFISELISNKLVIIGDFELSDMHETIYGNTPGPLILANQFISLENSQHSIPFLWVMYMIISFFILTYQCFWDKNLILILINIFVKLKNTSNQNRLNSFLKTLGFVTIIASLSYFIFDISIGIFFLAIYFQLIKNLQILINWIMRKFIRYKQEIQIINIEN